MYILLERNARGNLEVDQRILNKVIEFVVMNNVRDLEKFEIETNLLHDDHLFVLVKLFANIHKKLEIDELKLNNSIVFAIENAIGLKPKNIAFVYIKN
ncbi:hypothetical protein SCLARK_001432 [Spiroplasma clarkii]|uniref:Uncharacterized protein n=1 Tax=Spiroplasma clarkii TaxID=2139 RepID=A0A1Y0L2K8_9MOLU|nr:hypothetical protein [Spiroplasma clarkii]ARU91955.1 hypothetical protein SCLARK_001432 [Spiroplasma clarkii]ATX71294.1 hypothetical protein SCLAR_v1c09920 [Spiroplasma clarkii]